MNESVLRNGIVLIKGKPRGKNKEKMLYAGHVVDSVEIRPGATMLFMSDQFYRIIKEGDRLKGVKINWRSEESLKDSLNLKSPGKISIVKNNNKTPYHWKTLKETTISQALEQVKDSIDFSDYIFESAGQITSGSTDARFINEAVNSIFGEEKKAIVLSWSAQDVLDLIASANGDESDTVDVEHSAMIDFLFTDPVLVNELKEMRVNARQQLYLELSSRITYSSQRDPGEIDIKRVNHEITDLSLSGFGVLDDDDPEIEPIKETIEKSLAGSDDLDDLFTSSPKSYTNFKKYFNI